jgi:polo-like kinase 1
VKATYKKIKACSYAFPEHVTISDNARNLISKILVLDPSKRPTLEEIMADPFMAEPFPKTLPRSTLACPPAKNFLDTYVRAPQQAQPTQLSSKPSSTQISKKDSEKELPQKATVKEPQRNKFETAPDSERPIIPKPLAKEPAQTQS